MYLWRNTGISVFCVKEVSYTVHSCLLNIPISQPPRNWIICFGGIHVETLMVETALRTLRRLFVCQYCPAVDFDIITCKNLRQKCGCFVFLVRAATCTGPLVVHQFYLTIRSIHKIIIYSRLLLFPKFYKKQNP